MYILVILRKRNLGKANGRLNQIFSKINIWLNFISLKRARRGWGGVRNVGVLSHAIRITYTYVRIYYTYNDYAIKDKNRRHNWHNKCTFAVRCMHANLRVHCSLKRCWASSFPFWRVQCMETMSTVFAMQYAWRSTMIFGIHCLHARKTLSSLQ